ncbi:NUDIX domain-containing protein [Schaalia canis]|uniref:8-oxo-dGTP diphosphatase n=1 Tax=Schaalia canis TaxID=100469 RepID=A0A3P1SFV0_9ACTO|nr:NUDIX domain-containing protein [Schaalia canis]
MPLSTPSSDPSQTSTPRPIVAAAIVDSLDFPTRLLCASRAYPAELRGQFELPGGKVELGEAPRDALVREIREELGCVLTYGHEVTTQDGLWWPIHAGRRMGVWLAERTQDSPEPSLSENHLELVWAALDPATAADGLPTVDALPWIVHDRPIVERIVAFAADLRNKRKS